MKTYKRIELYLNSALIVGFICVFAITKIFELIFISCLILGIIQLLSTFIHIVKWWFRNHRLRVIYHFLLILFFVSIPAGVPFWLLLYVSPLIAVFYTYICLREYQILKFKELVHLK